MSVAENAGKGLPWLGHVVNAGQAMAWIAGSIGLIYTLITKDPRLFKTGITAGAAGALFTGCAAVAIQRHLRRRAEKLRPRIAVLAPLGTDVISSDVLVDATLQRSGFAKAFAKDLSLTKGCDIVFHDHRMSEDTVKSIIKSEIAQGTRFFFCTMTDACIPAALEISKLNGKFLVCGVTSAHDEAYHKPNVRRYYVRTADEINIIEQHLFARVRKSEPCIGVLFGDQRYSTDAKTQIEYRSQHGREVGPRLQVMARHLKDDDDVECYSVIAKELMTAVDMFYVPVYGQAAAVALEAFVKLRDDGVLKKPVYLSHPCSAGLLNAGASAIGTRPTGSPPLILSSCLFDHEGKVLNADVIEFFAERSLSDTIEAVRQYSRNGRRQFYDHLKEVITRRAPIEITALDNDFRIGLQLIGI